MEQLMCANGVCVQWRGACGSVDVSHMAKRPPGLATAEPNGPGLCCPGHDAYCGNMIYKGTHDGGGVARGWRSSWDG